MRLLGVKTVYHLSCGNQPNFPTMDTQFQVKCRIKVNGYRRKIYM